MKNLEAAILDVDGVLLASPHEQAWREALEDFGDPARFTSEIYQSEVAGKPRLDGALAALLVMGVPNAKRRARAYASRKQARLEALIRAAQVAPFSDAVRFTEALQVAGFQVAAASSSRNATAMLRTVHRRGGGNLLDLFDVDVSGRDVAHGKPAPDLFLLAATELGAAPSACFVVEDASAGVMAARNAGMQVVGVARRGETASLISSGATLVVQSLDEIDLMALAGGRLQRRPT